MICTSMEELADAIEWLHPQGSTQAVVTNNRECKRITVTYDNPDDKLLTHHIKVDYMDISGGQIDSIEYSDLSYQDCMNELYSICHGCEFEQADSIYFEEDYFQDVQAILWKLDENFNEKYEEITDLLAKQLDRMNFEYANTEEIIYKKEGAYKYLLKFDNEVGIIKFKVSKGDNVIIEKEWQLEEETDVQPIFTEIEDIYKQYGI